MLDFLQLLISLFSDFISFLDSFIIIGNISFLRLFIIIFIFLIIFKFLIKHKRGE